MNLIDPGFAVPRLSAHRRRRHGIGDIHAAHHRHRSGRGRECMSVQRLDHQGDLRPMTVKNICAPRNRARDGCLHLSGRLRRRQSAAQTRFFRPRAFRPHLLHQATSPPAIRKSRVMGSCTGGAYCRRCRRNHHRQERAPFLAAAAVKAATGECERRGLARRLHARKSGVVDHLAQETIMPVAGAPYRRQPEHEKDVDISLAAPREPASMPPNSTASCGRPEEAIRRARGDRPLGRRLRVLTSSRRSTAPPSSPALLVSPACRSASSATTAFCFESALKAAHFVSSARNAAFRVVLAEHRRLHGRARLRGGRHRQDGAKMVTAVAAPKCQDTLILAALRRRQLGMCGRAYGPRFCVMCRTRASQ